MTEKTAGWWESSEMLRYRARSTTGAWYFANA